MLFFGKDPLSFITMIVPKKDKEYVGKFAVAMEKVIDVAPLLGIVTSIKDKEQPNEKTLNDFLYFKGKKP
jgi:hypothetical protein